MEFFIEIVAGLALAHLLWAIFYCTGTFLMLSIEKVSEASVHRLLLDGLVRTALGASLFMLVIFLLGTMGALYRKDLVALGFIMPGVLFAFSWRRIGLRRSLEELGAPWLRPDVFAIVIYVFAIAVFAPALLAPIDWDPGMYHLAHAVDWANAGRMYVDPYVRFPLFAYNFELLYAAMFALRLGFYVQIVDWLVFLWSALGVYSLTLYLLSSRLLTPAVSARRRLFGSAQFVAFVATCVFCASPVVLRYIDTAYVDIAIGFFFAAMVAATVLAADRDRAYAVAVAAIGGSFIGMKLQHAAFVPLIAFLLVYIGVVSRSSVKSIAVWLGTLAIFGSPWYIRNLVLAGDPVSPILNLAFRRPDPYWSRSDYAGMMFAMHGAHTPPLLAPFMQFMHPGIFAEEGASLNVCLMLVPVAVSAVLLFRSQLRVANRPFFVACASTAYAACVFYAVSQYLRYSIEFYAVYMAVLAAMIVWVITSLARASAKGVRRQIVVLGSVCGLAATAIPSSAGPSPYMGGITEHFANIGANVTHPGDYFGAMISGYREAVGVSDLIMASGKHGTVLALGFENLAYVFRDRGIASIGDWFGPGRYSDVQKSIDSSMIASYLRTFNVAGVMILKRNIGFSDLESQGVVEQVQAAGFRKLPAISSTVQVYLRGDVLRIDEDDGFRNALLTDSFVYPPGSAVRFLDSFDQGKINSAKPAGTPTGRGVVKLDWPGAELTYPAITVVSGYTYAFGRIKLGSRPKLFFDVAKPLSQGGDALAWIDVVTLGKKYRVFSAICPPAEGAKLRWRHIVVQVPIRNVDATVTFGTDSLPGGGIADWIAFANPILQDAQSR